jgi:MOSC domain-containing protein YiiM
MTESNLTHPHTGKVAAIYVSAGPGEPMRLVSTAIAVAGQGLQGDRYFAGNGTYSNNPGDGRHLTMISAEILAEVAVQKGVLLTAQESRRNILTSGIDLLALVGREFTIGGVRCVATRICEPCDYLQSITRQGVLRAYAGLAGVRCEIMDGGEIRPGDEIRATDRD